MNFFSQEDTLQDNNESSFNFLSSNQDGFNFNQDTFAPQEFSCNQPNFVPINLNESNHLPPFSFNFSENTSVYQNDPQIFQFQSQNSFANSLFDSGSLSLDTENKNPNENKKNLNSLNQTNKLNIQNNEIQNNINIKQVEKQPINISNDTSIYANKSLSSNQHEKLINVNNVLKEVENLINPKLLSNNILAKNNTNLTKEIENFMASSKSINSLNFNLSPSVNCDSHLNYFSSSQSNISQQPEDENLKKRKLERTLEDDKKCPKLNNKLFEMNFFDNSIETKKNYNREGISYIVKQKVNNDEFKLNKNSLNDVKPQKNKNTIRINHSENVAVNSSCITSNNTTNQNTISNNGIKQINDPSISNYFISSSNEKSNSSNNKNLNLSMKTNKPQSKRHSYPNGNAMNKQHRNVNNNIVKMPIIQEENEQKEQEVDYKLKLEEYKDKFKQLQNEVNILKNRIKLCSGIYDIFNNYVNFSENFKIGFRNNFKTFLNVYQELICNYSLMFVQLNICNKIEKKTEEYQNIFKQLKDKISFS